MKNRLIATFLLSLLVAACASDEAANYTRDGQQYGVTSGAFRGRWWSYYERGSSFLEGDYAAEAISDFEKAVQGNSRDSWRARTYGLHFVEYFPNRELGIAYLKQGQLEQAEEYLNRSLQFVETDRAYYYLNLLKKEKIAQGVISDAAAPGISASLANGAFITDREIELKVDAKDDVGVFNMAVNGKPIHLRGSGQEAAYQETLLLNEGQHQLELAATDLADKAVTQQVSVTVDLTGPTIGIMSPAEGLVTQAGTITLNAAVVDKHGVVSVAVDEQMVSQEQAPRVEVRQELPLQDGENTFVVIAKDLAGNETRSAVSVFKGAAGSPQATMWQVQQRHPQGLKIASAELLPELLLSAAAEGGSGIVVKAPSADRPSRHNRTLRIAGEVVAAAKVTALTINGEALDPLAGAPKESFNKKIPVDVGDDGVETVEIAIHAEDEAGGKYDQSLTVEVRPVALDTKESKMPVAVLAFAGQGIPPETAALLRSVTEEQLLAQGRFRILDRAELAAVLQEQELSAALGDPNEALRLAKVIPAFCFIVADVFTHDQNGLEIKARVINTETSDLMATLDVFVTNKDDRQTIESACASLADQLRQTFPRLSGELLGAREAGGNTEVLVNWTQEDGIQEGTYMMVLQESEPWVDETTGEVLEPGAMEEVGRARVLATSPSSTRAQAVEKKEVPLEKGMPAISM